MVKYLKLVLHTICQSVLTIFSKHILSFRLKCGCVHVCMCSVLSATVYLLVPKEEVACHGNVRQGRSLPNQKGPGLKDFVQCTKHLLQMLLSFLGVLQPRRGAQSRVKKGLKNR